MRIIGIDPGLQRTGWGLIDARGSRLTHISHGVITTDPKAATAERLKKIFDELTQQMMIWLPQEAAIEETFVSNNAKSSLALGQARGAAMLAPAKLGLGVSEYAARLVKKSIVGTGGAEKEQIQAMIKVLLPGVEASSDAADALAVAICHANHSSSRAKMGGVMSGGTR